MIKRLRTYALSVVVSDVTKILLDPSHNLGIGRGNPINLAEDLLYTDVDGVDTTKWRDYERSHCKNAKEILMGRCWIMDSGSCFVNVSFSCSNHTDATEPNAYSSTSANVVIAVAPRTA